MEKYEKYRGRALRTLRKGDIIILDSKKDRAGLLLFVTDMNGYVIHYKFYQDLITNKEDARWNKFKNLTYNQSWSSTLSVTMFSSRLPMLSNTMPGPHSLGELSIERKIV